MVIKQTAVRCDTYKKEPSPDDNPKYKNYMAMSTQNVVLMCFMVAN